MVQEIIVSSLENIFYVFDKKLHAAPTAQHKTDLNVAYKP